MDRAAPEGGFFVSHAGCALALDYDIIWAYFGKAVSSLFVSYGVIFFFLPPFCLLWIVWLLGTAFAAVYSGKKMFRVRQEDIFHPKGSLLPLTLPLWGLSAVSLAASFILTVTVSFVWPWLGTVHSEWGIAFEQAWGQAAVYVGLWSLLYFLLLLLMTRRLFDKRIIDHTKSRKLLVLHGAASALCWELLASVLVFVV